MDEIFIITGGAGSGSRFAGFTATAEETPRLNRHKEALKAACKVCLCYADPKNKGAYYLTGLADCFGNRAYLMGIVGPDIYFLNDMFK